MLALPLSAPLCIFVLLSAPLRIFLLLFFCIGLFVASILLVGGLGFLMLVFLLVFRVSFVCCVFRGFDFASGVG